MYVNRPKSLKRIAVELGLDDSTPEGKMIFEIINRVEMMESRLNNLESSHAQNNIQAQHGTIRMLNDIIIGLSGQLAAAQSGASRAGSAASSAIRSVTCTPRGAATRGRRRRPCPGRDRCARRWC